MLRFLLLGDVVGDPGQQFLHRKLPKLKEKYHIDAVIVNGENAAKNGIGISAENINLFKENNILAVTSGNHAWTYNDAHDHLEQKEFLLRPANYPDKYAGTGCSTFSVNGHQVAIINLMGRIYSYDDVACPFKTAESLITNLRDKTKIILVDFHAETTYEKAALGHFLDGKVSAVFGTHTHIQTADEQILSNGTGFITDLGYCGALNSIIGFNKDQVVTNFTNHYKSGKFEGTTGSKIEVETQGPCVLFGALVDIDAQTGKTTYIERIRVVD